MEAKTNYTLVGLIVILLTSGLIVTMLWLSSGLDKKPSITYVVYLHEAVSGLSEDSVVKYNGVQVGKVTRIKLSHTDPQEVQILLSIEKGTPITTSTSATLISQGITGTTYLGLSASSSDLTPLQALPGQPYPIIPTKPSLFNQLDGVIKNASENINNVSLRLKEIFDEENAAALKKTLANLEVVTEAMANNRENINHAMEYSNTVLKNMAQISEQFPSMVSSMNTTLNSVDNASNHFSTTMETGKLTIDKLLQQSVPAITTLLVRLNNIAANLENLSIQLRQNPAIVIRGTSPPQPGPGETRD